MNKYHGSSLEVHTISIKIITVKFRNILAIQPVPQQLKYNIDSTIENNSKISMFCFFKQTPLTCYIVLFEHFHCLLPNFLCTLTRHLIQLGTDSTDRLLSSFIQFWLALPFQMSQAFLELGIEYKSFYFNMNKKYLLARLIPPLIK